MRIGSLFSGIGGLELGLEMAGLGHTIWQCESDPYARKILSKHWAVPIYEDITTIDDLVQRPDILCGGFPCQDISVAGKHAGLRGERSGLWREFNRVIRLLEPRLVIVENVPALLGRGMSTVLGDLAEGGYDCWWGCVSAADVGATHLRRRVFIVAYSNGQPVWDWDPDQLEVQRQRATLPSHDGPSESMADTESSGLEGEREGLSRQGSWWSVEPDVGRVAHGVSKRMDKLRCLGNAVVPQVAEVVAQVALGLIKTKEER